MLFALIYIPYPTSHIPHPISHREEEEKRKRRGREEEEKRKRRDREEEEGKGEEVECVQCELRCQMSV
jgi:hypothetical protein